MNMKFKMHKLVLTLILLLSLPLTNYAQKFAYVDTEYILSLLPDYKSAQNKLNELAEKWQKDVDTKYESIDKMYKEYQAEKILLTPEQQKSREDDIINKEKEAKQFQQDKFGYEGELFKKRQELVKPIQDKVFEAIQKIAKNDVLDFCGQSTCARVASAINQNDWHGFTSINQLQNLGGYFLGQ
jgi:outer membrane protein